MPIIDHSSYRPPPLLSNGHLQTILPTLLRRVKAVRYRRERITTPDGDFIDLDWSRCGSRCLVILCHGLEGSSKAAYMRGMARAFNQAGWDVLAYNYRGCSGEINRRLRAYHSGATDDLAFVHCHLRQRYRYQAMGLVGFSLGGNLVLKYLGENHFPEAPPPRWGVAISVPCDLESGARRLDRAANHLYCWRFLRTLKAKAQCKARRYPDHLNAGRITAVHTIKAFDDLYTAPVHGFRDAKDYWRRCSARRFLDGIRVPTLVVNALNDPFLGPTCFPLAEARRNAMLFLETPRSGGHVGFLPRRLQGPFWHETRVLRFVRRLSPGTTIPAAAVDPCEKS
jgi:predicted alpha/beta-fold hydrolase